MASVVSAGPVADTHTIALGASAKSTAVSHANSRRPTVESAFRIFAGACNIPDPGKSNGKGEDAWFVSEECSAAGVADGVGCWIGYGVDAGEFSRQLMLETQVAIEGRGVRDGVEALQYAVEHVDVPGTSTATLLLVDTLTHELHVTSIGDSSVVVLRGSQVVYHSPDQVHQFNCPYQLSAQRTAHTPVHDSLDLSRQGPPVAVPASAPHPIHHSWNPLKGALSSWKRPKVPTTHKASGNRSPDKSIARSPDASPPPSRPSEAPSSLPSNANTRSSQDSDTEGDSTATRVSDSAGAAAASDPDSTESPDVPQDAVRSTVQLQDGDLVVMATDGLWDNMYEREIVEMCRNELTKKDSFTLFHRTPVEKRLAHKLAHKAHHFAQDTDRFSPFASKSLLAGYNLPGGKMDDITVVVLRVVTEDVYRHFRNTHHHH